ncbi:hypothetical protein [Microbacterium paraoxydans]|uniref:hypothetical protein n=1 Tax=Microbacterium paraoxydans TaxID=199592 RepID=UPI003D7231A0
MTPRPAVAMTLAALVNAGTFASGAGPLSPVALAATLTMAALLLALATRRWRPVG